MTTRNSPQTICACCASLVLIFGSMPPQATMSVPSGVMLKTEMRSIDFIGQLIDVGIPSGVELLGGSGQSDPTVITPLDNRETVQMSQVLDAFNRQHPESRAEWRDDGLVVRPARDRSWILDAEVSLKAEQVATVTDGIKVVLSAFDRNVSPGGISSGAMATGRLGQPLYTPEMLGPVRMPVGRMTVLAAFNAIVRQLGGHAWVVMTEKQLGVTVVSWVGVLRREGWLVKIAFNDPKRPRL